MKPTLFIAILLCCHAIANTQTISQQAINSSGSTSSAGNITMEYSIGEMTVVQTYSATGFVLTQGLLQPSATINTPLPVTLLYFTGKAMHNYNKLSWATASEINSEHFDLQRSADGRIFETVKLIPAAGNSSVQVNYESTDSLPFPISYYRLKQIDLDGKFKYSSVIVLERSSLQQLRIFPNPALELINIQIPETALSLQLYIYDLSGNTVMNKTVLANGIITVDVAQLPKGMYTLKLIDSKTNKHVLGKFIKG